MRPHPGQRPPQTETTLDTDPPGHTPSPRQRPPGQKLPWTQTPWTETPPVITQNYEL